MVYSDLWFIIIIVIRALTSQEEKNVAPNWIVRRSRPIADISFQTVTNFLRKVSEPGSHRVARFFLVQNTKTGKIYHITTKYTKWP
jgi:hypothetical protein